MAEKEEEATPNRVMVYLRVRPENKEETQWFGSGKFKPIARSEDQTPDPEHNLIIDKSNKTYKFDEVFRRDVTQPNMFKKCALPTLEHVFNGYCGAVLAYGQTGTGKTHTMQGKQGDQQGIIPRSAKYIFQRIAAESSHTRFEVQVSFVQIYLDRLQDLFVPDAPEVSINHDADRVEMPGISKKRCASEEEFMQLFSFGEKHRVTRATKMNPESSRGHAALVVNILMSGAEGAAKEGKLVLVDLAGYERFEATGITSGLPAQEAKKINASLLALGSVVNALADAARSKNASAQHIPYRNAKLTRLLKDCLGGKSVSAIILTMGPCDRYGQETAGTLHFGWRAMAVKVDATAKAIFDPAAFTDALKTKLQEAKERIGTMAAWWMKSHPNDYRHYVQKYGEPDVGEIEIDNTDYVPSNAGGGAVGMGGMDVPPTVIASAPEHEDTPAEVAAVRKEFEQEEVAHIKQFDREMRSLAAQQAEEIKEAKAQGADARTLQNLKEQHGEERRMIEEQGRVLQEQIAEEKEGEEVKAMLTHAQRQFGTGGNAERLGHLTEVLNASCSNKDQLLTQLFDYICRLEEDKQENSAVLGLVQQDLEQASRTQVQTGGRVDARMKKENEELRTRLYMMNEELTKLKTGKSSKDRHHRSAAPAAGPSPGTAVHPGYGDRSAGSRTSQPDSPSQGYRPHPGAPPQAQPTHAAPAGSHPAPAGSHGAPAQADKEKRGLRSKILGKK